MKEILTTLDMDFLTTSIIVMFLFYDSKIRNEREYVSKVFDRIEEERHSNSGGYYTLF